jgi:hypothetical protein
VAVLISHLQCGGVRFWNSVPCHWVICGTVEMATCIQRPQVHCGVRTGWEQVKLFRSMPRRHVGGVTSPVDGGEWSASRFGRFAPWKEPLYWLETGTGFDADHLPSCSADVENGWSSTSTLPLMSSCRGQGQIHIDFSLHVFF